MTRQAALGLVLTLAAVGSAASQSTDHPFHRPPNSIPQPLAGADRPEPLFTREVMARGRERYEIFCTACHGLAGYGDGMVVRRGFPAPPSFHTGQQRDISPERIVEVITEGTGKMMPMGERIPVFDRWAIAAYVKALQLSQTPVSNAPDMDAAGDTH